MTMNPQLWAPLDPIEVQREFNRRDGPAMTMPPSFMWAVWGPSVQNTQPCRCASRSSNRRGGLREAIVTQNKAWPQCPPTGSNSSRRLATWRINCLRSAPSPAGTPATRPSVAPLTD
jgi:hypothetical protein